VIFPHHLVEKKEKINEKKEKRESWKKNEK
jgi:hypothetical protein